MRIYNGFSVSNGIVYGKVVTLFYDDEIFSQRKISFVSNAIDVIVDTIK